LIFFMLLKYIRNSINPKGCILHLSFFIENKMIIKDTLVYTGNH
jgi:hypothetical protein